MSVYAWREAVVTLVGSRSMARRSQLATWSSVRWTWFGGGVESWDIADSSANFSMLREQVRTPIGVVPFVGAGVSMPMGFESWRCFLGGLAAATPAEGTVAELLDAGEFESAAEAVASARGDTQLQVRLEETYGRQLGDHEILGPALLLPEVFSGPVVTTNFDRVLEAAYRRARLPFDVVLYPNQLDRVRHRLPGEPPRAGEGARRCPRSRGEGADQLGV